MCGELEFTAVAVIRPAVTLWPAMLSWRSDRVDVAFPCDGVVVVLAPAGRVAVATPPRATTVTTDRRVRTRETCTEDPPESMNTDEARRARLVGSGAGRG
jgi:hypothetical protein